MMMSMISDTREHVEENGRLYKMTNYLSYSKLECEDTFEVRRMESSITTAAVFFLQLLLMILLENL